MSLQLCHAPCAAPISQGLSQSRAAPLTFSRAAGMMGAEGWRAGGPLDWVVVGRGWGGRDNGARVSPRMVYSARTPPRPLTFNPPPPLRVHSRRAQLWIYMAAN